MRRRDWRCWLVCLALGWTGWVGADVQYRGFTIDDSAVSGQTDLEPLLAATRQQIDIVHAVGLPDEILAFLQTVPFELVPRGTFKRPTPGLYTTKGRQRVQVSAILVRIGPKPVLLHELMHALHDQRLPGGVRNPAILALYQAARSIPAFATKSHMMANPGEYFACTATAYLFGVTGQEPFSRDRISELQPACAAHLQSLFGSGAGHYVGTLNP